MMMQKLLLMKHSIIKGNRAVGVRMFSSETTKGFKGVKLDNPYTGEIIE